MMKHFGWAKFPMVHRISELRSDVPITFIYGAQSWIDRQPGQIIKEMRTDSPVDLHIIMHAGHHVYGRIKSNFFLQTFLKPNNNYF